MSAYVFGPSRETCSRVAQSKVVGDKKKISYRLYSTIETSEIRRRGVYGRQSKRGVQNRRCETQLRGAKRGKWRSFTFGGKRRGVGVSSLGLLDKSMPAGGGGGVRRGEEKGGGVWREGVKVVWRSGGWEDGKG